MHHELLDGTRRLIAECECENGCPGCVGPVGNTGPLAKTAALASSIGCSPKLSPPDMDPVEARRSAARDRRDTGSAARACSRAR